MGLSARTLGCACLVLSAAGVLSSAGTAALAAERAAAETEKRPNVLLIVTDDQGYGDFSLHGNPYLQTPRVDKLARAGVQFERFYVNSFCAPTRAALLTGRYPLRCGVWGVTHSKETMRSEEVTLAEAFRAAGYRTACIGKWHNGEQYPYTPPGQGFDAFFGFHNGHINNYFDTELIRGAQPGPTRGYITDVLTDEATRFLRANRDAPFFCYVAYNAPHSPYQVPDRFFDRFKASGLDDAVAAFYGMCENIDDNVGRLLDTLDELGLADDTIVVFLTDNGGTAGVKLFNAGMRGGKTSVHEGGCRVPLVVCWPKGLTQPRTVRQIASHIDLYPTLLDLCRTPAPAGPPIDGISLRPLLEGRESGWPERALFTHNPISETNRYPGAVRTQRYRLVREIRGPGGGSRAKENDASASPWQLYDIQADPGETRNLAQEQPEEAARLGRLYEAWFDDVSRDGLRRFPVPMGYTEENPVTLHAPQAYFSDGPRFACGPGFAHDWLTGWSGTAGKIWFEIDVVKAGQYDLELRYACPKQDAGSKIRVSAGAASLDATVCAAEAPAVSLPHRDEEGRRRYINRPWGCLPLGQLNLPAGQTTLSIRALSCPGEQVMEFKGLSLRAVDAASADRPVD
ncbi:MAG: arylsulfatase [Pirellulales bacterium]|nr:arylsulfatase [Pirellulales bacterium]